MHATKTSLAEIMAPLASDNEGSGKENAPGTDFPLTYSSSLNERIRAAYLSITGGSFNKRALLADLRGRLSDISRNLLDDALVRMQRQGDATLMQLDNRPDITQADREAAIQVGQEPRHILWISR
jgi:hypothetical protein